jgi:DNA polymerase III subunit gamma/tau
MATRKKTKTTSAKAASSPTAETGGTGYTVLARRYRSRDFNEIIGQEPIARTLQNAIRTGRTAHAYLFCGTRGVGKTSMARIFAKALNATDDLAQKDQIAEAILRGDDLDVIEIDGASNRGIADAKELIAGAGLSPARCRYKIYIIDEVHMLTREAFNALLKTMEEPPSHVKFILCTTEAHKVPQTIQSRCQRFDFRPIPTAKIAEQLRNILKAERIEADDDVVIHVAQLGNGSMRDALSLLDRLLAAAEGKLTGKLLEQMIGLPDQQFILDLTDAIISSDAKRALEQGAALINRGAPIEQILDILAEHFRHLMILATCGEDSHLLELSPEAKKAAIEQAKSFDAAGLVHLIAICDAVSRNVRMSAAARVLFDAALVRMAMSDHLADIPSLMRSGSAGDGAPRPHASAGKKKAVDESAVARAADEAPAPRTSQPSPTLAEVKPANASAEATESTDETRTPSGPLTGEELWQSLLNAASRSEAVRAKVEQFEYHAFDGKTLTLLPATPGAQQWQAEMLASVVRNETGRTVRIMVEQHSADQMASADRAPAHSSGTALAPETGQDIEAARNLPAVRKAMEIFDATIVGVRDAPQT